MDCQDETKINLSWTAAESGQRPLSAYYQLERAYGDVMFLDAERTDNGAIHGRRVLVGRFGMTLEW